MKIITLHFRRMQLCRAAFVMIATGGWFLAVHSASADDITAVLIANSWQKGAAYQVLTERGPVAAESFQRQIGNARAQIIYAASEKAIRASTAPSAGFPKFLVFFDNGLHAIGWRTPSALSTSGFTRVVKTTEDVQTALRDFETVFQRDPKELIQLRQYKGAFGSIDTGGRELTEVTFKGPNLLLKFLDGGQETTLELAPGFRYVSSSVGGKVVEPSGVEERPKKSLSDVIRNAEAAAGVFSERVVSAPSVEPQFGKKLAAEGQVPASTITASASDPKATPKPSPVLQAEPSKSTPWPWIIGAILLLAVAGGILLILRRK